MKLQSDIIKNTILHKGKHNKFFVGISNNACACMCVKDRDTLYTYKYVYMNIYRSCTNSTKMSPQYKY